MTPKTTARRAAGLLATALLLVPVLALASEPAAAPEEPLPIPLDAYTGEAGMTLWQVLVHRVEEDPVNLVATVVFLLAILHTFAAANVWRDRKSTRLNSSHRL